MITTLVVLGLSAALATMVWKLALRPPVTVSTVEQWNEHKLWVSPRSFAILVDPEEEAYLRQSLPAHLFRVVQRERILLAKELAGRMGRNAALLLQLAQRVTVDGDPQLARAAAQLSNAAARVRLHAFLAVCALRLKWMLPGSDFHLPYRYLAENELESRLASLSKRQVSAETPSITLSL